MRKKLTEFTDQELKDSFQGIDEDSMRLMLEEEGHEFDPVFEKRVQEELVSIRKNVIAADAAAIEEVPESILATIDQARNAAFSENETEEALLDAKIADEASQTAARRKEASTGGWFASFFSLRGLGAFTAAAAAVAVGVFLIQNQNSLTGNEFVMLTPGTETGFADPVFVWESEVPGRSIKVEVVDLNSGEILASADDVKSPITYSKLSGDELLKQGASYSLRFIGEDKVLLEREFRTTEFAVERGPKREETLDGVIRQCEAFIAAGRHADAWMLWHQLEGSEKQDPRMQELKKLILSKIS